MLFFANIDICIFKLIYIQYLIYRYYCRYKRDKLERQVAEANALKEMSDRRQARVETVVGRELGEPDLATFRAYVLRRQELLKAQRACEEAEKAILPSAS